MYTHTHTLIDIFKLYFFFDKEPIPYTDFTKDALYYLGQRKSHEGKTV